MRQLNLISQLRKQPTIIITPTYKSLIFSQIIQTMVIMLFNINNSILNTTNIIILSHCHITHFKIQKIVIKKHLLITKHLHNKYQRTHSITTMHYSLASSKTALKNINPYLISKPPTPTLI